MSFKVSCMFNNSKLKLVLLARTFNVNTYSLLDNWLKSEYYFCYYIRFSSCFG